MASVGAPFTIIHQLSLGGVPVTGLTAAADFVGGEVSLRLVNESGVSPAATVLVGDVDFTVEEIYTGTYAFKFADTVISAAGLYVLRIYDPGVFDELVGVVDARNHDSLVELAWLAGKNTVRIVGGHDAAGRPTQVQMYGFDTAADADAFAADPVGASSLVRYLRQEDWRYATATGRLDKVIIKVP